MPSIVWFRRDLRVHDHTALHHALHDSPDGVVPVFIFDDAILKAKDCGPPIVGFMLGCLEELRDTLRKAGGDLIFRHGKPVDELKKLAKETGATSLYYNKDYHPDACERDVHLEHVLQKAGVTVHAFKDQVMYEEHEILAKSSGKPYTVYSPYRGAWMKKLEADFGNAGPQPLKMPTLAFAKSMKKAKTVGLPTGKSLGHELKHPLASEPGESAARRTLETFCAVAIRDYPKTRNLPALPHGTSNLSAHLRHGTLSPRTCIAAAMAARKKHGRSFDVAVKGWIGELVWREFYQQVLYNFPHVVHGSFKPKFAKLKWSYDKKAFKQWCDGQTGYPIVDAAMRQLNTTGYMHNRLRMIVAMFLTKDLQIDWQWGERYFMQHLIDGETAQNNGNWQWSASTGTDAQPWFRIFNPTTQGEKFDPKGEFIKRFVPELKDVPAKQIHTPPAMKNYTPPMVDHAEARKKALAMFKRIK